RIVCDSVEALHLLADALAQHRNARHRRILVQPRIDRLGEEVPQRLRAIEIRKSLREIDGVVLERQPRHDREYGRADMRKLGVDVSGIGWHEGLFRWAPL